MSTIALVVVGCAVTTAAIKAAGPIAFGGRDLPDWCNGVIALLAPALLTALVVTHTFADGDHLAVGANTIGVGVAGVAAWRGRSVAVCVVLAALVTAGLRAL